MLLGELTPLDLVAGAFEDKEGRRTTLVAICVDAFLNGKVKDLAL